MVRLIGNIIACGTMAGLCVALGCLSAATLIGTCRRVIDAVRRWRETARHIDAAKRRAWNCGYKCGHKDGRKQGRKEATSK